MLQPPTNLKELSIDLYGGTSFPNWLGGSSFSNMPNCNEWIPFEGSNFAFPRLRTLKLHKCPELKRHLPTYLSSIEELEIKGCDHLRETLHTFHWLPSIKTIKITEDSDSSGCVERIQWSLLESDSPCMLQRVVMERCNTLLSVPKIIMSSTCLQHLELSFFFLLKRHLELSCIPSITTFPTDGLPTSLQSLTIHCCAKLSFLPPEMWNNYSSLVSLTSWKSCDTVTSFPLDRFPALQSLFIYRCKRLDSICISESPSRHPSRL